MSDRRRLYSFDDLDKNGDEVLSREEFEQQAERGETSYSTLAARSEDAVERVAWNRFALPAQDNSGHGTYPNHFRSAPHRSEQGYNGYFNLFDKAGRGAPCCGRRVTKLAERMV